MYLYLPISETHEQLPFVDKNECIRALEGVNPAHLIRDEILYLQMLSLSLNHQMLIELLDEFDISD
jgi:hypothetical protein